MTTTLTPPFSLHGISFKWTKHLFSQFDYFMDMMNARYLQVQIDKDTFVGSGLFEDQGLNKVKNDVVEKIKKMYINHVATICTSDENDCELKMEQVPFMTKRKSAGYFVMTECRHFVQGFVAYTGSNIPHEITATGYYVIFLDTSKLFPPNDFLIDCLDFSLIHLQQHPSQQTTMGASASTSQRSNVGQMLTSTSQSGNAGPNATQSDIARLANVLDKQFQDSHDLKQEVLAKWDPLNKTGISDEVIEQYDQMKDPNFIMTKSEMKKFNNPLTLDKNGNQQDQNYVLSPSNGSQYIIHRDGSLFRYLSRQTKKDRKEYITTFPVLTEWSAQAWADWRLRGQLCAYTYYAWIPPFYLVSKN